MTMRMMTVHRAGAHQIPRSLRGLGEARVPYDQGMALRQQVLVAIDELASSIALATATRDSPFLSRGNESILSGYIARATQVRQQLMLVDITEANRDVARMNYDEGQVIDMLDRAVAVTTSNPAPDMRTQVIRRAALSGVSLMGVVGGALYYLSRK